MKISLPGRRSGNLQDRRGARTPSMGGRSMGGGLPIPLGRGSLPITIIALVIMAVLGGRSILGGGGDSGGFSFDRPFEQFPAVEGEPGSQPLPPELDPDADLVDFVSFVLDDVQATWQAEFQRTGRQYQDAQLVLFTDAVQSGCGTASSATGPFYCPLDGTAYMDLEFFRELQSRFDAPGDFAQAYVIAHELGHHVQNITGVNAQVRREQESNPDEANELSIRLELQADCLAGIWGHTTYERGILESGDLEEGLTAAAAVGDDRIQRQATGRTNPETWTHGSSEQRMEWFRRGFDSGDPARCDTFRGDI